MSICGCPFRTGNRWINTRSTQTQPELEPWWDDYYSLSSYNKARVPFIQNGIYAFGFKNTSETVDKNRLDGIKILEVGCGGGILCEDLAKLGADVIGLDIDADAIEAAKKHQALNKSIEHNLKYINASIEEYEQYNREKYDVLVISEVIEHIPNEHKENFLKSAINTLKPGGSLFMTTPNTTILSRIIVIFVSEFFNILPKGTHDYKEFISPQDLKKMIENGKCVIRSIQGIVYNPLKKKFSISSIRSLFYAIHALKIM